VSRVRVLVVSDEERGEDDAFTCAETSLISNRFTNARAIRARKLMPVSVTAIVFILIPYIVDNATKLFLPLI